MKNKIGLWAFFIGMVLALATAFVNLGDWATQVLIVLGALAGGFHKKFRDEMFTFGVIYLALAAAAGSMNALIGFGPLITNIVTAWVRFLGPVVLTAFMLWGGAFLLADKPART